jgi:hypothetical protein
LLLFSCENKTVADTRLLFLHFWLVLVRVIIILALVLVSPYNSHEKESEYEEGRVLQDYIDEDAPNIYGTANLLGPL